MARRSRRSPRSRVTATASDSDGTVSAVAFYANGALIGSDSTSPYSIDWSAAAGSYRLIAVATDNAGHTSTSGSATVVVGTGSTAPKPSTP